MCIVHACMYIATSGDGLCIYHGYANERQRCELHMSKRGGIKENFSEPDQSQQPPDL